MVAETLRIGCGAGFFIASYTGALLSATNQPITDLGDRLDPEDSAGLPLGNPAKAGDDAIDCVLSDDPAFPDKLAEVVLADHSSVGPPKGD